MFKKTTFLVVLTTALVFASYGLEYDAENDFTVKKSSDGKSVIITGYAGKNTDIRIPPQIQKKPVT